jgi:hypoxanthine phosphoribosyltransferase
MDLFQKIDFKSSAGLDLKWKIECDAISDDEWECIATMIMERSRPFRCVIGIPRGGIKLAKLLDRYSTKHHFDPVCIVDDVLTTGGSMEECRSSIEKGEIPDCSPLELEKDTIDASSHSGLKSRPIGWVVFARNRCPLWINPLFQIFPDDNTFGKLSYHNQPWVQPKEKLDVNY